MVYEAVHGLSKPISRIVFGTLWLTCSSNPFLLLDHAWRRGCNCFDSAASYEDGKCEEILGAWIADRSIDRSKIVLCTKGGCYGPSRNWKPCFERVEEHVRGSLQRLGVHTIDLYVLHRDDPAFTVDEIVHQMDELRKRGLINAWGVSNWTAARLHAALEYAKTSNKPPPVCDQRQLSLAEPACAIWPGTTITTPESRALAMAQPQVKVMAWECLAKGFLAGADITQGRGAERLTQAYLTTQNVERRRRLQVLAETHRTSTAHLALRYVASQPYAPLVLIGTTNLHHLDANIDAVLEAPMSSKQLNWLCGNN